MEPGKTNGADLVSDLKMYKRYKIQLKKKAQEYGNARALYNSLLSGGNREIDKSRHGYNFLIGAESITEKRLAVAREMVEIRTQFRRLDFILCRLLDVLRLLDGEEYKIISSKYIHGHSWQYIAIEVGYDISTLHRKKNKALARIAPLYNLDGLDDYVNMAEIAIPQDKVLFPYSAREKEGSGSL